MLSVAHVEVWHMLSVAHVEVWHMLSVAHEGEPGLCSQVLNHVAGLTVS